MNKDNLAPYKTITNGDMSAATLTSTPTNIINKDNVAIALVWTGSPVGTFAVNVSQDKTTWIPLTLSTTPVASGSAGSIGLDLNQLAFPHIQVVYTKTSGTGTLNCTISAKQV